MPQASSKLSHVYGPIRPVVLSIALGLVILISTNVHLLIGESLHAHAVLLAIDLLADVYVANLVSQDIDGLMVLEDDQIFSKGHPLVGPLPAAKHSALNTVASPD